MPSTPSQRWSSVVHDLFACARGRLPPAFLAQRLKDAGAEDIQPLPAGDIPRLERAVDLVNAIAAGRPIPGGQTHAAALDAAFPADHPTLAGLRRLADEHLAALRPAKREARREPAGAAGQPSAAATPATGPAAAGDAAAPAAGATAPAPQGGSGEPAAPRREARARHPERGEAPARGERGPRRPARPEPEERRAPAAPAVSWEAWRAHCLPTLAGTEGARPAALPEPLAAWTIDDEARRIVLRIHERCAEVVQAAPEQREAALRELTFAILRAPLAVRDELRTMLADFLQRQGLSVARSALYPPPPLAAMKKRWEELLAERGAADPAVQQAWERMLAAHPEARAKLEAERERELSQLLRRLEAAARNEGADAAAVAELRAQIFARFAAVGERVDAVLAAVRRAQEAAALAGRLVAERPWDDPEVQAALAALDEPARRHFDEQRQHELEELQRRFQAALREQGPDGEAVQTALERLATRFPAERAAAEQRLQARRRERALAEQERAREAEGRSPSAVHLGAQEHRLPRLAPQPAWRLLVVAAEPPAGGERRPGRVVVLALPADAALRAALPADWRPERCERLEELDLAVQTLLDAPGLGILGLPTAEGRGPAETAALALRLACLALPRRERLVVRLLAAEPLDAGALSGALANGPVPLEIAADASGDQGLALARALAASWAGDRPSDGARVRQSGLLGGCLLSPPPAVPEALRHLWERRLPPTPLIHALIDAAEDDAGGVVEALLAAVADRLAEDGEALLALHRHLMAQRRHGDPARRARALAWLEGIAEHLRPRERLRLFAAAYAAQAASEGADRERTARLLQRCAELREDYPAEAVEASLAAAAAAREALDLEHAELLIAPWQRSDAVACGGRPLALRLAEERARIAAAAGRWKDALRHLERAEELARQLADGRERGAALPRLAALRATVLADDPHADEGERRRALEAALGAPPGPALAAELAEHGAEARRLAHAALLAVALRRQDEVLLGAYLARRERWCQPNGPWSWGIAALRAVALAAGDAEAARALLALARERCTTLAERLAVLAAATAAQLLGAAQPELREQYALTRRHWPRAASVVAALERALARHPDTAAGLAEALPLLPRP